MRIHSHLFAYAWFSDFHGVIDLRKSIRKMAIWGILAACLAMPSAPAYAMPDILPVSEMQSGMTGTAYTVVEPSGDIEPFQVDIVGVLSGGKGSYDMIMARAYGPLIDRAGGVLQGMSGSPVYIDDKLVGAVAIGLKEMNLDTFFITPIENMLPLWDMPDNKNKIQFKSIDLKKVAEEKEKAKKKEEERATKIEAAKDKENVKDNEADEASKGSVSVEKHDTPADIKESTKGTEADSHEADIITNDENSPSTETVSVSEEKTPEAAPHSETTLVPEFTEAGPDEVSQDTPAPSEAAESAENVAAVAADGTTEQKSLLCVSGFGRDGLNFLSNQLAQFGDVKFLESSSPMDAGGTVVYDAVLEPGGPMGVALMYGDFSIAATGTVTAVDGDRVLGFGHEFLHQGNVNYFMTDASVIGTINGQSAGMKIANVGNIVGRINQDRSSGVAGILGKFPEVVPVRVHVKDNTLGREENYGVRIAYNEDLLPQLGATVVYAALNKVADTVNGSTATVHFTIRTNATKSGKVERTNMFYNVSDVGQIAVMEMAQAITLICTNTAEVSDILDVQVDVELFGTRKTASLISAIPDKIHVKPGETVNFKTRLKPYRQQEEELTIPYTVPKTQPEGRLNLDLRGGGLIPVSQAALLQQQLLIVPSEDGKLPTTEESLNTLLTSGRNNEIIIAPGAVTEVQSEKEQKKAIRDAIRASKENANHSVNLLGEKKDGKSAETKFETNYIIENAIRASLQVER